jgi:hypothetical protein
VDQNEPSKWAGFPSAIAPKAVRLSWLHELMATKARLPRLKMAGRKVGIVAELWKTLEISPCDKSEVWCVDGRRQKGFRLDAATGAGSEAAIDTGTGTRLAESIGADEYVSPGLQDELEQSVKQAKSKSR